MPTLPVLSQIPKPGKRVLPVNVLLLNVSVPAKVASVPVVGKVTLVVPVVVKVREYAPEVAKASAKVTFLPLAKVKLSVPPKAMELVFKVVESLTVNVFEAPRVKVPVPVVMVLPL